MDLTLNVMTDSDDIECENIGILVGLAIDDTEIEQVIVKNSFIEGNLKVGGLVGFWNDTSTSNISNVKNSHVYDSEIEGNSQVGGLIGYLSGDSAKELPHYKKCASDRSNGDSSSVGGGIVGKVEYDTSRIIEISQNFVNKAEIEGANEMGGIVGLSLRDAGGNLNLNHNLSTAFFESRGGGGGD